MDETFSKLIQRGTYKKEKTVGNPWDVIPIKNRKQARECIEIYMAKRGIQQIKEFENFPNLEVLYLNDNKIEQLEGLDANFRIKNIYLENNCLKTLEGSLEYLTHLEILLAYNNELRDLDKNIEFLKRYPNLKQLDLFQNPICEEPNYRLRVIYNLPQLKLLDRHIITNDERVKAKKLMEQDDFRKRKKEIKKKVLPSQMFSQGEIDCYREASRIRKKQQSDIEMTIKLEEERKLAKIKKQAEKDATKVPRSKHAIELEKRRKEDPTRIITEFEKDKIRKIFKKYDHEKKAEVKKEDLGKIYSDLQDDEGIIGIVPDCSEEEFIEIIASENEEVIDYDTYRFRLNSLYWEKPNIERTQERIKQYYHKANQKINRGNKEEAYQDLNLAIRLQSKLSMDDTKPVFATKTVQQDTGCRFDSFDFGKYTFKKTFSDTAKHIL